MTSERSISCLLSFLDVPGQSRYRDAKVLAELEKLSTTVGAYAFVVVLGLLWGSFANVCIYRWPPSDEFPHGRSVVRPGSHCFACKKPIRWYDNVPILSWLWLRGQCRSCHARFSPRYLIVEAVTGALFGVAWYLVVVAWAGWEPFDVRLVRFAVYAAFCVVLVVIAFIDLDHKLILNKVTVPSIVVFYALGVALLGRSWDTGLVGIAIGYGVPWLIGEVYMRLRGRDGLGLGDGMLLALVGALLGWRGVVVSLFGGSMIGIVIALVVFAVTRRRSHIQNAEDGDQPSIMHTELPFGPFLAMAALFYLFAEPWIELHFRLPGW
jgi:leader peptidase (prepilin peptidase) / N-methyltransferase